MFTGIIKELGRLGKIEKKNKDSEIEIISNKLIKNMKTGDSISVNGCCLTVKELSATSFKCDISSATMEKTAFKYIKPGEILNLEDALTLKDKIGGHLLSGHVDNLTKIERISKNGDSIKFYFKLLPEMLPYIVTKGSVAIDGISLTVAELGKDWFCIAIIPYTYQNTNLKSKNPDDFVNIEIDLILRYLANLLKYKDHINLFIESAQKKEKNKITIDDKKLREKLIKYGFIK